MKHYDWLVVGGGFSGTMAALAAAREGLSVLLVEKSGFLGGAAINSYVFPFMHYKTTDQTGREFSVNRGLFAEVISRLKEYGGIDQAEMTFNEEYLKLVLDDMTDTYGVDVLYHSTLIGADCKDGTVRSVTVANVGGTQTLTADYFADATGDALLSLYAGCSYHVGRDSDQKCQPMTLCFRMGNVDVDRYFREDKARVNALWKEKLENGELLNPRENILTFRHPSSDILHLNSTRVLLSTVDPVERSRAEKIARRQMLELYRFLKEHAPSCKDATLLTSATEIGVRESRMIDGLYSITEEDISTYRKFDDAIAAGNYGIDIHSPDGTGTYQVHIPAGQFYTIPYRAIVPKEMHNLLVVGRCISSSHEAQAAYRVMSIVASIGEGAGIAVSIAKKHGIAVAKVPTDELRQAIDRYDLVEGYTAQK